MNLSADDIFSASDSKINQVEIPEWGGTIFVKTMSGIERDKFESDHTRLKKTGQELYNFRARFAVCVVCDQEGTLLFKAEDAEKIGCKSAKSLDRIFEAASAMNGMTAEDVETLEKN